jgi:hypothetical protein
MGVSQTIFGGGRLLAYRTAIELDLVRQHPDPERLASAQPWQAPVALQQRVLPEFDLWISTLTAQRSAAGKRNSDAPS